MIEKIKKTEFVMDEDGYTDAGLVSKVNEIIDWINNIEKKQRPKGHWILFTTSNYPECSVCHKVGDCISDFCPNCGADMREVEA